jgi:hypothetical protein
MKRKSRAAQLLGKRGGLARARNLSPEQLREAALKAVAAREAKRKAEKEQKAS